MKKISIIICLMISYGIVQAQHQSMLSATTALVFTSAENEVVIEEVLDVALADRKPSLLGQQDFNTSIKHLYAALRTHFNYPEMDRLYAVEGDAVFRVLIDAHGELQEVMVLKSPSEALAQSFVSFLKEGFKEWTPAQKNGRKIPTLIVFPIHFRLH